jgi:ATP-dependent helicase Lhr and Lhr-like helicase
MTMTSSPPSSSDGSVAFDLLDERIQRWIYREGWPALRPVQEQAIREILGGPVDVIVSAPTAGGKTEAAFLPVCSAALSAPPQPGIRILYVAPLKALINDQFGRAEAMCEGLGLDVHRWHGDVAAGKKKKVLEAPSGLLLITPESLEALFVLQGSKLRKMFAGLSHVIVDELHAFIGSERGRQLQSLLHRVERLLGRRVPRVALSATLGDMEIARRFLRPADPEGVRVVTGSSDGTDILLQLKGYRVVAPPPVAALVGREPATALVVPGEDDEVEDVRDGADRAITAHLLKVLRGTKNLVFANARTEVENFADRLRVASEAAGLPNEFFAHHGSLAKDIREDAEALLKDESRPVTVVCTSTLEMGIDIGSVKSIAQIGAPHSVASIRQRLGRSGRRGEPASLRFYIREEAVTQDTAIGDTLRPQLLETIAIVSLMLERWNEPPTEGALHLSTLVQQVLSILAQRGGASAAHLFDVLCATGPFHSVGQRHFSTLLRHLGSIDLIVQDERGTLGLGRAGERLVNHFTFYAAFQSPEEFRLLTEGRVLGSMPILTAVLPGTHLVFAGRRWLVQAVDEERKTIDLLPAKAGRLPRFASGGGIVHRRVRERMKEQLGAFEIPKYLDSRAVDLLGEARENFARHRLYERSLLEDGKDMLVFPWTGDRIVNTLMVWLNRAGLATSIGSGGTVLIVEAGVEAVERTLAELAEGSVVTAEELALGVKNKAAEKYDGMLPEGLLAAGYARRMLDVEGARRVVGELRSQPR